MGRPVRILCRVGAAALVAVPLYLLAPPTTPDAVRRYLDPAARIRHALAPGESIEAAPTWTAWVAYPVAAVEAVHHLGTEHEAAPGRPAPATAAWTPLLRALWAWMLGLVLLEVGAAAALVAGGVGSGRGAPAVSGGVSWVIAITAGLALAAASFADTSIAHLLPGVPAGLLLFWLLRARDPWWSGVVLGMLLAWFGFLWPLLLLAWVRPVLRPAGEPGGSNDGPPARAHPWGRELVRTGVTALFVAMALVPERLRHPLAVPAGFVSEWRREGGLGGPGGGSILSLLTLSAILGPVAWVGWPVAGWRWRHEARRIIVPAGALALGLVLPILLGLVRPGSVQWSVTPLLAAWGAGGALFLLTRKRFAVLGALLALALVVAPIPSRVAGQKGTDRAARSIAAVRAELGTLVPRGELLVTETDPRAPAGPDSAASAAASLVVPRDSRSPGRYDDFYWYRWYAGFRWVLLSGARVAENLDRPDAATPRAFYQAVERDGRLMRVWGAGDTGFRLYRINDGTPWRRPLTEEEVAGLHPSRERSWFLSRLGSLYLDSGQSAPAEEVFRLATQWDPENAGAWNNLGAAFLRRGDNAAAAKAFDEGLKRAPTSFELLLNYGRACSAEGLYERGERYLLQALGLRPDYAPVHYELARVFLAQGKNRAAAEALRRTLALDPSSPRRAELEAVIARLAEDPESSRAGTPSAGTRAPEVSPGTPAKGGAR